MSGSGVTTALDHVVAARWDETWHRLREWTNGQAPSERLSAQVLLSEGFTKLDPSHPLGGPDGLKDALCGNDGAKWVMAVFFPRGQKSLREIKKKLLDDLLGVAAKEPTASPSSRIRNSRSPIATRYGKQRETFTSSFTTLTV